MEHTPEFTASDVKGAHNAVQCARPLKDNQAVFYGELNVTEAAFAARLLRGQASVLL